MLMSYGSVERNLLIFYRPFLFRHLIVLHHVPIVLCIVYPLVFYTSIIYGYPCVNALDYTMNLCGGPCFTFDRVPSVLDLLVNLALVELIGVFANIVLVTRVVRGKDRMKRNNKWKKTRRLLVQVLSVTSLHNVLILLVVSCGFVMLFSSSSPSAWIDLTFNILQYGVYLGHLLSPFVTLLGLPELWPRAILGLIRPLLIRNRVLPIARIQINRNEGMPQQQHRIG